MYLLKRFTLFLSLFLFSLISISAVAGEADQTPSAFNSTYYTIEVNGVQRDLLFHLPQGYVQGSQLPVLFNFHGYGSNAADQEIASNMSQLADEYGFIVIYPQGLRDAAGNQFWSTHTYQNQQSDIDFVSEMLRLLGIYYGYEPTRVYATGFSNGGGFANLLAAQMSETFAAVSSVGGAYYNYSEYTPARDIPIIAFHGDADEVVPFEGLYILPPIYEWVNDWAAKNACGETAEVVFNTEITLAERWSTGCEAHVELYTLKGIGHIWPTEANGIDVSQVMLEFFVNHPLR